MVFACTCQFQPHLAISGRFIGNPQSEHAMKWPEKVQLHVELLPHLECEQSYLSLDQLNVLAHHLTHSSTKAASAVT